MVFCSRDESAREGVRVVVDLKRDAQVGSNFESTLQVYFQTSFGINMLALNKGVPELINLKKSHKAFYNLD